MGRQCRFYQESAGADVGIDGIDARRADANQELSFAGLGLGRFFEAHDFRPAELMHTNRFHIDKWNWFRFLNRKIRRKIHQQGDFVKRDMAGSSRCDSPRPRNERAN